MCPPPTKQGQNTSPLPFVLPETATSFLPVSTLIVLIQDSLLSILIWAVVLVSEGALAILFDYDRLPPMGKQGGVLTSMTGLGDVLLARLSKNRAFSWETHLLPVGETRKTA